MNKDSELVARLKSELKQAQHDRDRLARILEDAEKRVWCGLAQRPDSDQWSNDADARG